MAWNFSRVEKKWQKAWKEKRVFESDIDAKKEKFFFTTPYPYISGSLHLGHGRAVTEGDVYTRFLRMSGKNVLFPMAFHISGTPILGISAAIKNGNKEKIALYESYVSAYVKDVKKVKDIVESFSNPNSLVKFFIPKMIEEYSALGLGVDWTRSFTSGDALHRGLVTWQFKKYHEHGYLIKDKHPVLYSPNDQSAMGEDDIQDADSDSVEKQEFSLVKFEYKNKFLVCATLRPETIFGVTNLWVNPDATYVDVKVGSEIWIISKEGFDKLQYQRKDLVFMGFTKEHLIGARVTHPLLGREVFVLPAKFVDSDIATGVVMSVPSDAPYDYVSLCELQEQPGVLKGYGLYRELIEEIEVIPIIKTKTYGDKAGVFLVEKHGIVRHDDSKLEKLTQEAYREGFHTGVLLDVCKRYAGMSVKEARDKIKVELGEVMYETSRKAVSRTGGKIIVAVLDDQWFIDFNSPGWKDRAKECLAQMKLLPESYRAQFEDAFRWLDKRPCARRRGLGTAFPFDKGWIVESLSDSTIYMVLYTIADIIKANKINEKQLSQEFFDYVLLGKGDLTRVSKDIRVKSGVLKKCRESFLYWMPVDLRHTFVLHLSNHLSFMIFAFAGLFPSEMWPKKISFGGLVVSNGEKMSKSKGNVITLLNVKEKYGADVFRFYHTSSSNLDGTFDWRDSEAENARDTINRLYDVIGEAIKKRRKGVVSKIYTSKFNRIIRDATDSLNGMKLRDYGGLVVHELLRLVREAKLSLSAKDLGALYWLIAEDWIRLIAPVCPHIAEELWVRAGKKGFVSVVAWPRFDPKQIDEKLEVVEKQVETTVSDVLNLVSLFNNKGTDVKKVYLYTIPSELGYYSAKALSTRVRKEVVVCANNDAKKYDPLGKSSKAKPGRPAIYLE